jgi:DNA polymerase III epsilon subunit-like protein
MDGTDECKDAIEEDVQSAGMKEVHENNYGTSVGETLSEIKADVDQAYEKIKELSDLPKILFFDTETSGFIKKDLPADHPDQAWTVQIGALLTDTEGKQIDSMNVIIKANGREMNPFAEEVHGISVERADEEGIEELEAAEQFGLLLRQASMVVGHNFDFDWKYAQHLLERNIDKLSDEARSAFYLDLPNYCTMKDKAIVKFCGLKNKANKPKWPKNTELHSILFGEDFDAHDAFNDIIATARNYFELIKRGIIEDKLATE